MEDQFAVLARAGKVSRVVSGARNEVECDYSGGLARLLRWLYWL